MKVKPLHLLPNREGYRFTGVFSDDSHRDCEVIRNEDGSYTVREWAELTGWLTNEDHEAFARMYLSGRVCGVIDASGHLICERCRKTGQGESVSEYILGTPNSKERCDYCADILENMGEP